MRCQKCDYGYVKAPGENMPYVRCSCCGGYYVNCKNCAKEAENAENRMVPRLYGDETVQETEN